MKDMRSVVCGLTQAEVKQVSLADLSPPRYPLGKINPALINSLISTRWAIYTLGTKSPPFKGMNTPKACRTVAAVQARFAQQSYSRTHQWAPIEMMWNQDPGLRPIIINARYQLAQCGIMGLVQRVTPLATAMNAQHPPITPAPFATDDKIHQVFALNSEDHDQPLAELPSRYAFYPVLRSQDSTSN